MFKQLREKWETYVGPKDERILAEERRLESLLSRALLVICLVTLYYANALRRAAYMFGDPALEGDFFYALPPEGLLCAGVIISCTLVSIAMTRTGSLTSNRFAETDVFPAGYFALCSALGALAVLVGMFAVESFAQAQLAGIDNVYWAANLSMAALMGAFIFCGCMLGFYLYFLRARRNRARIEAELGE